MYDFDKVIQRTGTASVKWDPDCLEESFARKNILPLWVADMDFECPKPVVDALTNRAKHGIFGYTVLDEAYYNSVIRWHKTRHKWNIKKEWIVFTPGIVTAVNQCIQAFCKPNDNIIIQNPVYYPFEASILNNSCNVVNNQLVLKGDHYEIDFDDLLLKAKDPNTKMMILCNPHNPVGRIWSEKDLMQIARICIDNNIIILSDEIHSDLILGKNRHINIANLSDEIAENTITCTAPSKTFNIPGLQASNIIISNKILREKYQKQIEINCVDSINVFAREGLIAAYNHGDEWLDEVLVYLQKNVDFIDEYIKEKMPKVIFNKPEGTYLGWLDFRQIEPNKDKLDELVFGKAKVALDSGHWFGSGGDGFMRINFACPTTILQQALEQIEKAIKDNYIL